MSSTITVVIQIRSDNGGIEVVEKREDFSGSNSAKGAAVDRTVAAARDKIRRALNA